MVATAYHAADSAPIRRSPRSPPTAAATASAPEREAVLAQEGGQLGGLVPPHVTYERVEGGPAGGMQRHREHDARAGLRDAAQLREHAPILFHVLDDVEGAHEIEGAIAEG